jgi:hypothetical protein
VVPAGTAHKTLAVTNGTQDQGDLTATSSRKGKSYNRIKQDTSTSNVDSVCCLVYMFVGKMM